MSKVSHFLTLKSLDSKTLTRLIHRASELKAIRARGQQYTPLKNKTLVMIFDKASTRTRVSFEAGMTQLGGHAIFLAPNDSQLGRGEPVSDSAGVISSMVDGVMIRTFSQQMLETFAANSKVPVINGLTDTYHPCQLLADMQTWYEHRGEFQGKTVAWVGDGNNMCHSYINAAVQLDFNLNIATPEGFEPDKDILRSGGDRIKLLKIPAAAVKDADLVVTDVWASMGQEQEQQQREKAFSKFQVNSKLMQLAKADALFMHCLPAHRGEEVSANVIDGPQSVVWDEAENRLHAQNALLEHLLSGD